VYTAVFGTTIKAFQVMLNIFFHLFSMHKEVCAFTFHEHPV